MNTLFQKQQQKEQDNDSLIDIQIEDDVQSNQKLNDRAIELQASTSEKNDITKSLQDICDKQQLHDDITKNNKKGIMKLAQQLSKKDYDPFNKNQELNLPFHKFVFKECFKIQFLGFLFLVLNSILNLYVIKTNCNVRFNNCLTNTEKIIHQTRFIYYQVSGVYCMIYFCYTENQKKKSMKIRIISIYIFFQLFFLLSFMINTDVQWRIPYQILGVIAQIFWLYSIKENENLKWGNYFEQFGYQLLYLCLYGLCEFYKINPFLNDFGEMILSNLYTIGSKKLVQLMFLSKLQNNINKFEEIRIILMIFYLQDLGLIYNSFLTKDLNDLIFVYINYIVMVIFNLTNFHFWMFIIKIINNIIFYGLQYLFGKGCLSIKNFIIKILVYRFGDYQAYFKNLIQQNYEKPCSFKKQHTLVDVKRGLATYYVISHIQAINILIVMFIFNTHIPFLQTVGMEKYLKKNVQLNSQQQISSQLYKVYSGQPLIIIITFFIVLGLVHIYQFHKNINYFGEININKKSIIVQLIIFQYTTYQFCWLLFK